MSSSTTGSQSADGDLAPDLYDYDFENDPVATLNRLRAEDPVHWSRHGFWYLTRYEDCAMVLKDPARFSSAAAGWGGGNPLATAKARRRAVRRPRKVSAGPSPSRSTRWTRRTTRASAPWWSRPSRGAASRSARPRIQAVIDELLDAAAAKGQFDLITDFAFHVPIIVASEIIGIPVGRPRAVPRGFRAHRRADGAQALGGILGGGAGSRALGRPLRARPDRRAARRARATT